MNRPPFSSAWVTGLVASKGKAKAEQAGIIQIVSIVQFYATNGPSHGIRTLSGFLVAPILVTIKIASPEFRTHQRTLA